MWRQSLLLWDACGIDGFLAHWSEATLKRAFDLKHASVVLHGTAQYLLPDNLMASSFWHPVSEKFDGPFHQSRLAVEFGTEQVVLWPSLGEPQQYAMDKLHIVLGGRVFAGVIVTIVVVVVGLQQHDPDSETDVEALLLELPVGFNGFGITEVRRHYHRHAVAGLPRALPRQEIILSATAATNCRIQSDGHRGFHLVVRPVGGAKIVARNHIWQFVFFATKRAFDY